MNWSFIHELVWHQFYWRIFKPFARDTINGLFRIALILVSFWSMDPCLWPLSGEYSCFTFGFVMNLWIMSKPSPCSPFSTIFSMVWRKWPPCVWAEILNFKNFKFLVLYCSKIRRSADSPTGLLEQYFGTNQVLICYQILDHTVCNM